MVSNQKEKDNKGINFQNTPKTSEQQTINFLLLSDELCLRANPVILMVNMKGGKRAEAGQWFLEIQKLLYGIRESVIALENFMNQIKFNKKVMVNGQEVSISDEKRYWVLTYLIDNANLRIFACLDKLAQMVRVYYEHPEHGGELTAQICWRCGHKECKNIKMDDANCNFKGLVDYLHKNPRDSMIDDHLFELGKNQSIKNLWPYRTGFVHRKSKLDSIAGLDPDVQTKYKDDSTVETVFSFGKLLPSINWFRVEVTNAHNAVVECIEKIGKIIFPKDFEIKIETKEDKP